jgi:uncharacterized protein (DUF362 family)
MQTLKSSFLKYSLIFITLISWMWWDLSQAHTAITNVYKSFFLDSEMNIPPPSQKATIAIVQSNDPALGADTCSVNSEAITYTTIYRMVKRAVDLAGGLQGIISPGNTVLIKPNIVHKDSSGSGGVTDIRVVKALVFLVDEIAHGQIRIIVGDGSPITFTTFERSIAPPNIKHWDRSLYDMCGYQQLACEAAQAGIFFHLSNLNGNSDTNPLPELDYVNVPGGGYAQPQGGRYYVHKDVTHADVYISVPVMKIHQQTGFTCALKNQIGLAASTRYGFGKCSGAPPDYTTKLNHYFLMETTWHNWQDKEIVDLSIIAKIKFVVVDAISCLESKNGPIFSKIPPIDSSNKGITNRIKMNTIIAGRDPVAVDNVCCRIMMLNPDDIEHITLAERAGLGINNSDKIIIVGPPIEQIWRPFRKPQKSPFDNGNAPVTTNIGCYGQGNRTWLLSECFLTNGIDNPMDHEFIPKEASLEPTAGVRGWSQPIYFTDDQILLNDYYTTLGNQSAVSYAFTYFYVPHSKMAELWVGSDEDLKIYLNGNVVYKYRGYQAFAGNELFKEIHRGIHLQQGLNRLLVKSYQSMGKYTFSLNICDYGRLEHQGNRVLGLKFLSSRNAEQ